MLKRCPAFSPSVPRDAQISATKNSCMLMCSSPLPAMSASLLGLPAVSAELLRIFSASLLRTFSMLSVGTWLHDVKLRIKACSIVGLMGWPSLSTPTGILALPIMRLIIGLSPAALPGLLWP